MSMPPPPTPPQTGNANAIGGKTPLTEDQKRANHVKSEQKRRNEIRIGCERLASLLNMKGQGKSEARILELTVQAIKEQLALKEAIKQHIEETRGQASVNAVDEMYREAMEEAKTNNYGIGPMERRGSRIKKEDEY
ncbi:hypothetical protein B0A48_12378 [Cryoendolithus antarcticus]|uniref:BHLH domain-containing protein n=1 Tax=Cryoendolithus antarcticus TaxID=1507870 RepID=A0A1V8SRU4_9PEZI|nr:hypothetical protein B0A48_12378 [Cryoendolithus antarcticus]